jgi:predicted esterase
MKFPVVRLVVVVQAGFFVLPWLVHAKEAEPQTGLLDAAHAYRKLELEIASARPLSKDRLLVAHRSTDRAAWAFLFGDYRSAVYWLTYARQAIVDNGELSDLHKVACCLGLTTVPEELIAEDKTVNRCWLLSLYDPRVDQPITVSATLGFRARSRRHEERLEMEIPLSPQELFRKEIDVRSLVQHGEERYDCELTLEDGFQWDLGSVMILQQPRTKTHQELISSLESASRPEQAPAVPALDDSSGKPNTTKTKRDSFAVQICKERIDVLIDNGADARMTRWLFSPAVLRDNLVEEIAVLRAGGNPYTGLSGDHWIPLPVSEVAVPCRIYVPTLAKGLKPPPLMIALHGAGGNEHMFFEALGGARIKALADQRGFVLVAPATAMMMRLSSRFPDFLGQLAMLVAFDRTQVHLIGHSMGGMAAMQMSSLHPDLIRRSCLIAGGSQVGILAQRLPPTRIYAAEFDHLIPLDTLRVPANKLTERSLPVAFHEVKRAGHVLVVAEILDEAVNWLLSDDN